VARIADSGFNVETSGGDIKVKHLRRDASVERSPDPDAVIKVTFCRTDDRETAPGR
jgi:hypothetical protein